MRDYLIKRKEGKLIKMCRDCPLCTPDINTCRYYGKKVEDIHEKLPICRLVAIYFEFEE